MSDNWIVLIPEDPEFIPTEARQFQAQELFKTIAPDADEIELNTSETVAFYDCGANFERILCPLCGSEIPMEWWMDRMDDDFDGGFNLDRYSTPCCDKSVTLNELNYEWPQGFGRFALEAMNPNIGGLADKYKSEFETILATRLRVIYRHI